ALAAWNLEPVSHAVQQGALDQQQAAGQADDQQRPRHQDAEVGRHADRHEEQAEQQSLERLQVAHQLVPVFRVRQQHAGGEGAERQRQADPFHQQADADDEQQREGGEQLAQPGARQQPHDRVDQAAAEGHQRDEHGADLEHAQPAAAAVVGRHAGQQRHQRDHRDGGDVLQQQDRETGRAGRAGQQLALAQRGQHDGGGRQRQAEPGHQRDFPVDAKADAYAGQHRADHQHLGAAPAENRPAQVPQLFRLQLKANQEQHQHDTEFGDAQHVLDIADQLQPPRADDGAGDQVAEHCAHADALGQRHQQHGGHQ
ncbi:conserved hypothetical protein, partial [Ricinus communis]